MKQGPLLFYYTLSSVHPESVIRLLRNNVVIFLSTLAFLLIKSSSCCRDIALSIAAPLPTV